MYKLALIGLVNLITVLCVNGQSFKYSKDYARIYEETIDSKGKYFYDTLITRFLRDDISLTNMEILALQIGFSQKDVYSPYEDVNLDRAFIRSANRTETDTTVWYGSEYLKRNPLSLSANFALWKAYEKRNQYEIATLYKFRFNRLVESISSTGNGTKKPYFVLSPFDGQILIEEYWKAEIGIMGSAEDKKGNFLDMLEMIDRDGTSKTLFFVIEHAIKRMW